MELIATVLTRLYLALPMVSDLLSGTPRPSFLGQFIAFLGFYFGGLFVLSVAGIGLVLWRWRSAGATPAERLKTREAG